MEGKRVREFRVSVGCVKSYLIKYNKKMSAQGNDISLQQGQSPTELIL